MYVAVRLAAEQAEKELTTLREVANKKSREKDAKEYKEYINSLVQDVDFHGGW